MPAPESAEHEWLWGWDPTPGIVSVWADADGVATVWRRTAAGLVREQARFRPWLLLDHTRDLEAGLARATPSVHRELAVDVRTLAGPGALRYLVSGRDGDALAATVLAGAAARLGHRPRHLRELGDDASLCLPPDEQYLVASGRTYFRDLAFDDLRRLQLDLETTGLDPAVDRIFLIAVRAPTGEVELLEAAGDDDGAEATLLRRMVARIAAHDPDVIENHNLHGFDLPFLVARAERLGVALALGRTGEARLRTRPAMRGAPTGRGGRKQRYLAPGRELIDTMDAVLRHAFATHDLASHGLKDVARSLGVATADREYVAGDEIHATYQRDPARVRRYATGDVEEVAAIARTLGGAAFALARLVPRRYERLADAGPATGVIDPLLVRAYLRAGQALPAHDAGDGTPHSGAALHLFAAGVAHNIMKADVASLYPSLMRAHRIGPARDRLGALLALVDRLVEQRLAAKAAAKLAPASSTERHGHEAMSAAMKLVVNSAYGYLAAGGLTRFADVHAANAVTRHGRATLALLCRELAARGLTLLEADTDGVYAAMPAGWGDAEARRVVAEVGALLPPLVQLELEGTYAAMLSHEPKNYALLDHAGALHLRGVAFRSSRAEPFGEAFLRRAIGCLLRDDVPGVRAAYLATAGALRDRRLTAFEVSSRVRLSKSPEAYAAVRATRRELPYEALLSAGRDRWNVGERVRVYRARGGGAAVVAARGDDPRRDYDVPHYLQVLRDTFAARLVRALAPADFAAVFADVDQLELFATPLATIRPVLTAMAAPRTT
jgi:DNA polymerase I